MKVENVEDSSNLHLVEVYELEDVDVTIVYSIGRQPTW